MIGTILSYEVSGLTNDVASAIRPYLKEGEKIIRRDAFRWKDDGGVLSNHYECMKLEQLAEVFGYEIVHNFCHVGVVRKK